MDPDDIPRLFGRKIRECRKRAGLSQEELAERIGKSPDTVSNIERGFTSTRIRTAAVIAAELNVPLGELFNLQEMSQDEKAWSEMMEEITALLQPCDQATRQGALEVLAAFVNASSRNQS